MTILILIGVLAVCGCYMWYTGWRPKKSMVKAPEKKLSILLPFTSDDPRRRETCEWVLDYYRLHLPANTEFVVGENFDKPFCKTKAVNHAASRATGDIFVILDSDCFMRADDLTDAADRIRAAAKRGNKVWFVPYRRFYRLTEKASDAVLKSNPRHPHFYADPPPASDVENIHSSSSGHWWGALVQIMPRAAFEAAGGMDERFTGWGGEDISFLHAVDTMWGKHKTTNNAVWHLWHPSKPGRWKYTRMWEGQEVPEMNDALADKYERANNDYNEMKKVINYPGFIAQ